MDGALRAIPVEDPNVLEDTDFEEILRAIPVDEEEEVSEGFSGDEEEGF